MRYIFYTLLLANIGYFGYAMFLRTPPGPPVTVASAVASTQTIYLLSEKQPDPTSNEQLNTVINNPIQTNDANPAEGSAAASTCFAVGPFDDIFSGQAVVKQLQALDINTELRAFDQPTGKNDYRVLIPPADSLQDAFRKLRELKSRKIDSYVITQGEHALGISLGVFSDRDAARQMQTMREKQGYSVEIAQIPRYSREFWVFSTDSRDVNLDPKLWQSLVSEHSGLQRRAMPCPGRKEQPHATDAGSPDG